MTLPLIHSLQKADWLTRRRIIYAVKNNNGDNAKVAEVIKFVKETGGLDYAIGRMWEYHAQALDLVRSFEPSPARASLEQLITYTIEREK